MSDGNGLLLGSKRALITGASRGMGAAMAEAFAAAGADLALVAQTAESLASTAEAVRKRGRDCLVIEADLATEEGARHVGKVALGHADAWDILVNNAGVAITMPLATMTVAAWDTSMAVNLRAPMLIAQALVPKMIERHSGKIINISSLASFTGGPTGGAYAASKAALNELTRTMAVEWGQYNIQVNAICPTITLTEMGRRFWLDPANEAVKNQRMARIPAHRFAEVADVSDLALFLAGPNSGFINGLALPLDGGQSVSP
jgi:2-dehydro-3-deoxy-D-gluconate 5-dehydrogenase